jgi:ATP-dependent protease ClpP protease subunit
MVFKWHCIKCNHITESEKEPACDKCGGPTKRKNTNEDDGFIFPIGNDNEVGVYLNEEEGYADILLLGDVGMDINGDEVAKIIRDLQDNDKIKVINERINSNGGLVTNGFSIVSANLNSEKEIRTFNDGIAASMAGIILMTGDKIFMNDYATLMIHDPSIDGKKIEEADEEDKKGLIAIRDSISKIIQNRTGKGKREVDKIMNEESWYNAKQSKAEGFIDKVIVTKNKKTENFTHKVKESYIRKAGDKWEVVIIQSGLSLNGFYYTDEVLDKYKKVFEGINVYAHSFGNYYKVNLAHRPEQFEDPSKLVLNKVGWIKDVKFKREGVKGCLVGTFHCINSALTDILNNTYEQELNKMPELSVDIDGDGYVNNGIRVVTKIMKVRSVDLVDEASAGGKFLRLVAGTNIKEEKMDFVKQLLALIKEGKITMDGIEEKKDEEIIEMIKSELNVKDDDAPSIDLSKYATIEDVKKAIADAIEDEEENEEDEEVKEDEVKKEVADKLEKKLDDITAKIKEQEAQLIMKEEMNKDTVLPAMSKDRISESFNGREFTRKDIQDAIKKERQYLESLSDSGTLNIKEGVKLNVVKVTDTPLDQKERALDMLIDPELAKEDEYKSTPAFTGIREAFHRFTGVTVDEARKEKWKVKEASTSDFPIALGTSMNKKMIKDYTYYKAKQAWEKFAVEEIITNTNEQTLSRFGEFDDLATVAEAGTYAEFATPSEDNPTYTPIKVGNVFTLTEEMLINDNLRAMQKWPKKMAQAAIRTLSKYVYNRITGCDGSSTLNSLAIYDGGVLYSSAHGNLGSTALGYTAFESGVSAMNEFNDPDAAEPLFIEPSYLLTTTSLRATAWDVCTNELIQANANGGSIQNVYNKNYSVQPLIVPSGYLCGSTTLWILIAAPSDVEGITVGYVNKNTPEILLQDNPTVATVFTNDQIRYKVKFRYGAAITDWRAFYGYV